MVLGFVLSILRCTNAPELFNIGSNVDIRAILISFMYTAIVVIRGMKQQTPFVGLPYMIGFLGFLLDVFVNSNLNPLTMLFHGLWFWQKSTQGAVGYPGIQDGFFNFSFPHTSAPALDSSTHLLSEVQEDDSSVACQTTSFTLRAATANVLTLYSNQAAPGRYVSARHEALMRAFHQQGVHLCWSSRNTFKVDWTSCGRAFPHHFCSGLGQGTWRHSIVDCEVL